MCRVSRLQFQSFQCHKMPQTSAVHGFAWHFLKHCISVCESSVSSVIVSLGLLHRILSLFGLRGLVCHFGIRSRNGLRSSRRIQMNQRIYQRIYQRLSKYQGRSKDDEDTAKQNEQNGSSAVLPCRNVPCRASLAF